MLRANPGDSGPDLLEKIIRPEDFAYWSRENLEKGLIHRRFSAVSAHIRNYKGFSIRSAQGRYYAHLLIEPETGMAESSRYAMYFEGTSIADVCADIDRATPWTVGFWIMASRLYITAWQALASARTRIADPSWRKSIVSSARHLLSRLLPPYRWPQRRTAQFSSADTQLADSLADIIPNLYHLGKVHPGLAAAGKPIVLVDSMRFAACLKLIAAVRALPPVQIVRMATTAQLRAFLSGNAHARQPLVLARNVYYRYYSIIGADQYTRNAAVI
jgi:hypothetical protein